MLSNKLTDEKVIDLTHEANSAYVVLALLEAPKTQSRFSNTLKSKQSELEKFSNLPATNIILTILTGKASATKTKTENGAELAKKTKPKKQQPKQNANAKKNSANRN